MDRTVGRFASRFEAEMARQLLDDAGIPARLRSDDVGAMHPELGQVGERHGITLVVAEEHLEEAKRFLATTAEEPADWEEPLRPRRRRTAVALLVVALGLAFVLSLLDVVIGGPFGR